MLAMEQMRTLPSAGRVQTHTLLDRSFSLTYTNTFTCPGEIYIGIIGRFT